MEHQRDEGKNVMTAVSSFTPAVIVTRRGALEPNAPQSIAEPYAAASRRPGPSKRSTPASSSATATGRRSLASISRMSPGRRLAAKLSGTALAVPKRFQLDPQVSGLSVTQLDGGDGVL
jgi:hypothetical protein